MATSNVNVRVDSDLKKQAEILFSDLGLNMSTAINIFLRAAISHGGLPFEVKLTDLHPKERTSAKSLTMIWRFLKYHLKNLQIIVKVFAEIFICLILKVIA